MNPHPFTRKLDDRLSSVANLQSINISGIKVGLKTIVHDSVYSLQLIQLTVIELNCPT